MTEGVAIIADWLRRPDYGVNAVAALLPRGAEPAPPVVSVADAFGAPWVARGEVPREVLAGGPWVAVAQDGDTTFAAAVQRMAPGVGVVEAEASYVIEYVTTDSASAAALRDAKHILRAIRGSLWLLHDMVGQDARTQNGFELVALTGLRVVAGFEARGDALVAGAVVATYLTRETAPYLIP